MQKVILALLLTAVTAGKYDRSMEVSVKDTAVPSLESTNFVGKIETSLSDQLAVGGEYDQTVAQFKPRTLFARWTSKGSDPMEMTTTYNVAENSAELEMEYERSGTKIEAAIDTRRPAWFKTLSVNRGFKVSSRDVSMTPAYDFGSKMSSLKTVVSLNADTDMELQLSSANLANVDELGAVLSVEHKIDARNTIKPTFALNSGNVNYEYTRQLSEDADGPELVANVNPGDAVNIKWEDQGSSGMWTTNLKMPWGKPAGSSVSFKRTLSL